MWKMWTALGVLSALLAGCQGERVNDPLLQLPEEEEALLAQAEDLANQAEALFADLLPTSLSRVKPLAEEGRSLTVVVDEEEQILIASLTGQPLPESPGGIWGNPMNVVIKCGSDGRCPPRPKAWVSVPLLDEGGSHRLAWMGGREEGTRQREVVPLEVAEWGGTGSPSGKQKWSYNKLGIGGFWADSLIQWPDISLHLLYPLPSIFGQLLNQERGIDLSRFTEGLRAACCGLPKPFEVEWPPALLMRGEVVLAFVPYRNPRLTAASSPEELLGEPLGIAYLRQASGAKLTKADAARMVEIKLLREEPDWTLVATNLKDPADVLRFRVGQVEWCDGCFGQDPPPGSPIPRRLSIEDRPQGPALGLQVGRLLLRGIEKKDIRR